MRRIAASVIPLVASVAITLALSASSYAERPTGCGMPGKPPCPLQAWMRIHVAAPLALRDLPRLADGLERLQALNPEPGGWKNWNRFAAEGAGAARDGNENKAQQSCTRCHEVYRGRYNDLFRGRALPEAYGQR